MNDEERRHLELLARFQLMEAEMQRIKADTKEIKDYQRGNLVTRQEFEPIQKLVYGLVGLLLLTIVGALLSLVIMP